MKYTEEQAKEVLNDFKKCVGDNCQDAVDTWLNTKFQKLPETGLVVMKSHQSHFPTIAMRTGKDSAYGFRVGKYESEGKEWSFETRPEYWRPATKEDEERWKELLIEEAKRRGFVEGAKFKGVVGSDKDVAIEIGLKYNMKVRTDGFDGWGTTGIYCGNSWILHNGKWASIIKDEKPKEEPITLKDTGCIDFCVASIEELDSQPVNFFINGEKVTEKQFMKANGIDVDKENKQRLLDDSITALKNYLNAGDKEQRRASSVIAKKVIERYNKLDN